MYSKEVRWQLDRLDQILTPHIDCHIPKTPENQVAAKQALLETLSILEKPVAVPKVPRVCIYSRFTFLEGLETVFMALERQDYLEACNEVHTFLYTNWMEESHDEFVGLLQKIKNYD